MKPSPVHWFEIYVEDMERARAFYEAVFRTTLVTLENPASEGSQGMEMWMFPAAQESPGCCGALVKMDGFGPGPGGTVVYFESEDCAVEAGRVAEYGGTLLMPKFSIGEHGFCAMARDSEGNVIGLHSMQ